MDLDLRKCAFQAPMRRWIGLERYATLGKSLQKERVHAFGGTNVDRRSHRIDKIPQQANFWFPKAHSLPRSPFQQRAVRAGYRQGSPQHAIDLQYNPIYIAWLGPVAHGRASYSPKRLGSCATSERELRPRWTEVQEILGAHAIIFDRDLSARGIARQWAR